MANDDIGEALRVSDQDFARYRLLICSPGVPHESRGASTIIMWHYISGLKKLGFQIRNLLFIDPESFTEADLQEYITQMAEPGRFEVVPFYAHNFYRDKRFFISRNNQPVPEVAAQGQEFQPDLIFYLDILPAWIGQDLSARIKFIWLGDLNFDTIWYHAWYSFKENPKRAYALLIAWWRTFLWKRIYRDILRDMDWILVSSKSSEERLQRLGLTSTYQPYPWPVQGEGEANPEVAPPSLPTFLFFGNLAGLGSRSGLHFLTESVYPRLLRLWGKNGFKILIAGRTSLPDFAREALQHKPEFEFLGFVEDLDRLMAGCHAVLAPIDVPVGNRCRILTTMFKRQLVIAHKNTALGNPDLIHGETCLLAEKAEDFVDGMRLAVEHPEEVSLIKKKAWQSCCLRFSPEAALNSLKTELEHLLSEVPGKT